MKIKILFFFVTFFVFGCDNNAYLNCNKCSDLKGLVFYKLDQDNLYHFDLAYPVGIGSSAYFRPHFKIKMFLKLIDKQIYEDNSEPLNMKLLWDLDCQDCLFSNEIDGFSLTTSIDTVFFSDKLEEIYALRIKNIWKETYDNPMGSDFVMFVSESGVKGMYISQIGDELFDVTVDEKIFYPIGEIYYLRSTPRIKIVE